jgi:hypothetical protein
VFQGARIAGLRGAQNDSRSPIVRLAESAICAAARTIAYGEGLTLCGSAFALQTLAGRVHEDRQA